MRAALILTVLLAAAPAIAENRYAKQGDVEVRIYDAPCTHAGTLGMLPPAMRPEFHKAEGYFGGKRYYGCWREMPQAVQVFWEDGDQGIVPLDWLKAIPTV